VPNLTAAAYAAILDPEHEQKYWWTFYKDWIYYGPHDLHTSREHAWRGEEWLEARGVGFSRSDFYVDGERTIATRCCYMRQSVPFEPIINHAAAIAEAVRRISNETR
jgi:hypothetical protein